MKKSKQRKCIQTIKLALITIKKSFLEEKKIEAQCLLTKMSVFKISLLSYYHSTMIVCPRSHLITTLSATNCKR